ncbi:GNAT family N-acetyltransferase [Bacillus sp. FJAT-49711]|uniref:GNAT family N-acetyltransferase n=1 Tax=Bacillus sp. FJAT-49711 TaxID=2833585 RepID=UPI001BC9B02C|nr:GNAT family N-acetyltransferase [Bacillus sp. FJAT-49711]MBS4220721.1 GNAT family N-acetyltransferase [Bacillus sp. FJAT-49711]
MQFRKIKERDIVELDDLFQSCLKDLVTREKKSSELIETEVERLNRIVQDNLLNGKTLFFVTEIHNQIVGTIALTKPNEFITDHVGIVENRYEVGCVYILPSFQRKGIGKFMFQQIKKELVRLGQEQYYLDAGFSSSQQYWKHVLGEPSIILHDYWGKGEHHLIWARTFN